MTDKTELRKNVRQKLRDFPQEYIENSDAGIFETVTSLDEFRDAETVFTYYSVGREVDTRRLINYAFEMGKKVALPISMEGGIMEFADFRPEDMLRDGRYKNIPEPDAGAERLVPTERDVFIVPALCFDVDGYRLGQGGGYYDRYLARYSCRTVGLCRQRMLMQQVPRGPYDMKVSCFVTEEKVTRPL